MSKDMNQLDVARIREDFPILRREVNGKPLVYLDNAATSQKPRAMIQRMSELYSREYARVEEGHTLSQEATRIFEGTRAKVSGLINAAEPCEIIFCRGAQPYRPRLRAGLAEGWRRGAGHRGGASLQHRPLAAGLPHGRGDA